MSRYERRLRRYALLTLPVHGIVALHAAGTIPRDATLAVLLAMLLVIWAWGPYHTDLTLHPGIAATERRRWRIAFFLVPGAMTLYWLLHVRGRSAVD